jgi:hypothetical protein
MKSVCLLLAILTAAPLFAGEETLLGAAEVEHGGFGALVVKFTPINKHLGVLVGGRGGWIINHTFSLGLAGYGLANNVKTRTVGLFGPQYIDMGYGGLDLEYINESDRLVHFSVHTLIGAGAVGSRTADWTNYSWSMYGRNDWEDERDVFFVFEPGVNLDLNMTTWFRTSLGAGYRFVSGVSSDLAHNSDLAGPSVMLSFRFGSF